MKLFPPWAPIIVLLVIVGLPVVGAGIAWWINQAIGERETPGKQVSIVLDGIAVKAVPALTLRVRFGERVYVYERVE